MGEEDRRKYLTAQQAQTPPGGTYMMSEEDERKFSVAQKASGMPRAGYVGEGHYVPGHVSEVGDETERKGSVAESVESVESGMETPRDPGVYGQTHARYSRNILPYGIERPSPESSPVSALQRPSRLSEAFTRGGASLGVPALSLPSAMDHPSAHQGRLRHERSPLKEAPLVRLPTGEQVEEVEMWQREPLMLQQQEVREPEMAAGQGMRQHDRLVAGVQEGQAGREPEKKKRFKLFKERPKKK